MDLLEQYLEPYFHLLERYMLKPWAKWTFFAGARIRLYKKIASMTGNGVKLKDVVDKIYAQAEKRGRTETMTIILADINDALKRGDGLSKALMSWADPLECMVIASGETSGNLGEMLLLAAGSLAGVKEMRWAILLGTAYPVALFIAFIGVLYFIGIEFLPGMTVMADPKTFHGSAAILYWYSNFVQTPWFWLIVGLFVTVNIIIIKTLPNAYGSDRFRVYLDNVPPWSIYRLLVGSNFFLALGALLKAGVKLDDSQRKGALTQIKNYSPPYLALRINALQKEIRSGRNFGEALEATGYQFPSQEIIDDMVIYSALPQFDQILFDYGKQWIKDGTEAVKLQVAIFSGVALLIMSMAMALLVDGVSQIEQQMGETVQQINY